MSPDNKVLEASETEIVIAIHDPEEVPDIVHDLARGGARFMNVLMERESSEEVFVRLCNKGPEWTYDMRAHELIKEASLRRTYIWAVHLVWMALYVLNWWLFPPDEASETGKFILALVGVLFALALGASIFGDDIVSGRLCVLVTRPFWSEKLYIYRIIGLSLQGAVYFLVTGCLMILRNEWYYAEKR